jgi:hypothetical protein
MKRDTLISRLKQLLNAVDKLEFNVEQNRKQIAETRLLVANLARTIYFAEKTARRKTVRKRKTPGNKKA